MTTPASAAQKALDLLAHLQAYADMDAFRDRATFQGAADMLRALVEENQTLKRHADVVDNIAFSAFDAESDVEQLRVENQQLRAQLEAPNDATGKGRHLLNSYGRRCYMAGTDSEKQRADALQAERDAILARIEGLYRELLAKRRELGDNM